MHSAAATQHSERLREADAQWRRRRPHWHPGGNEPERGVTVEVKRRESHLLSDEEAWAFDVHGFLVIKGALQGGELAECQSLAAVGSVPAALATHPAALRYVEQFCGAAWRLEAPASLVEWESATTSAGASGRPVIAGGNVPHNPSRAYYHQNGSRWCQGLRAMWALSDVPTRGSGLRLLPASHTLNVPIPEEVLRGEDDYLESLGMELQPELEAGDLLLHAATLAHGLVRRATSAPPRLCSCSYLAVYARPADPSADVAFAGGEPFLAELGPVERSVLGLSPVPGEGLSAGGPGMQAALLSDGEKTVRLETPAEVAARAGLPYHPSGLPPRITSPATGAAIVDPLEFFYWELTGFLVVRGAMDSTLLAAANAVLDRQQQRRATEQTVVPTQSTEQADVTAHMAGTSSPDFQFDLMSLQDPADRAPFIRMLAHPALVQRLSWMMGGHFRAESLGRVLQTRPGGAGQGLHGNGDPIYSNNSWWNYNFESSSGRLHTGQINVAWQLHDVTDEEGGFVVVPGSHHARLPLPSNDSGDPAGHKRVLHPQMNVGDLLLFMGGATTHGAWSWPAASQRDRRAVLNAYWSKDMARLGWVRGGGSKL